MSAKVGLDLLPGPGELQPRCSCPDFADPCKHAAAVCYLVADALDDDPFGVLLLRGLGRDEVLAALRARRRAALADASRATPAGGSDAAAGSLAGEDPGVPAREAWHRPAADSVQGPDVPAPPPLPLRPGAPTVLAADPPAGSGLDVAALRALAADAAARALGLARGAPASGLELTEEEDLARRAATLLPGHTAGARDGGVRAHAATEGVAVAAVVAGQPDLGDLAARAGLPARQLLARALAYRDGGAGALIVLEEMWDPPGELVSAGRTVLGPGARATRNRVTLGERQLRLGRDGRWYPMRKQGNAWLPDGRPLEAAELDGDGWGELDGDADGAGLGPIC